MSLQKYEPNIFLAGGKNYILLENGDKRLHLATAKPKILYLNVSHTRLKTASFRLLNKPHELLSLYNKPHELPSLYRTNVFIILGGGGA
jgi:hypothetical protein